MVNGLRALASHFTEEFRHSVQGGRFGDYEIADLSEHVANFLWTEIKKAETHLGFVFRVLMLLLGVEFAVAFRKRLTCGDAGEVGEIVKRWKKSRLGARRDFVFLLENLAVMSFFDRREVLEGLGVEYGFYQEMMAFYRGG